MKPMYKSLAAAVSLALASAAAHAQLAPPSMGTAAPASNQQLALAIWDSADKVSEIVSLNYTFADLTAANFNPTSPTSPFTLATNPSTGTGSVYQLNFGVVPGWSTTFTNPTTQGTSYLLVSQNQPAAAITDSTAPVLSAQYLTDIVNTTQAELNAWPTVAGTAGYFIDPTASTTLSINSGAVGSFLSGTMGTVSDFFGAAVGSALNFYTITPPARGQANGTATPLAGFFNLASNGTLTYNVAAAVSAVPLPAAFWLLASGVAGLGTIGRRRRAVAA